MYAVWAHDYKTQSFQNYNSIGARRQHSSFWSSRYKQHQHVGWSRVDVVSLFLFFISSVLRSDNVALTFRFNVNRTYSHITVCSASLFHFEWTMDNVVVRKICFLVKIVLFSRISYLQKYSRHNVYKCTWNQACLHEHLKGFPIPHAFCQQLHVFTALAIAIPHADQQCMSKVQWEQFFVNYINSLLVLNVYHAYNPVSQITPGFLSPIVS